MAVADIYKFGKSTHVRHVYIYTGCKGKLKRRDTIFASGQ